MYIHRRAGGRHLYKLSSIPSPGVGATGIFSGNSKDNNSCIRARGGLHHVRSLRKKRGEFYHVCTRLVAIFSISIIEQRMVGSRRKPLAGFQKVIWPSHLGLLSLRLNFKAQMETMQLPATLGCLRKQACGLVVDTIQ
jgi:hypothetical protein